MRTFYVATLVKLPFVIGFFFFSSSVSFTDLAF
jgi:hypothetical protein